MAKKMRNGLTQKQRKTQNKRVANGIDIYIIRPSRPMRANWKNYPDPTEGEPVEHTKTRQAGEEVGTDEARMGLALVADAKPLAGEGVPPRTVCHYCGETDGHTGQCPVVSHHLGILARWFCEGCTAVQRQGRFPCRECCGYTASAKKVVRGVKTAHGKPNVRCLP